MELEAKHFSSALYLSLDITKGSTLLPPLHTTVTLARPSVVPDRHLHEGPLCSLCHSRQVWRINTQLNAQQDYIHKVPVILHENCRSNSHKPSRPSYINHTTAAATQADQYRHLHRSDCRNKLIYAHTTSRTLLTCDISLGSLTLSAPETGDFVELLSATQLVFQHNDMKKNWHCGR